MGRTRALTSLVLAVALAGCGRGTTAPAAGVVGRYDLRTVEGAPLPYVLDQGATSRYEIPSGSLTLGVGGTFVHEITGRAVTPVGASTTSQRSEGSYVAAGAEVLLRYAGGNAMSRAVLHDRELTLVEGGRTFVYRR